MKTTTTYAAALLGALLATRAAAIEAPVDDAPPPPPAAGEEAAAPAAGPAAEAEAEAEAAPAAEAEVAYLGVVSESVPEMLADHLGTKPGEGLVVRAVMPDGPAAKAGLAANDIILKFGGEPVGTPEDLTREVQGQKAGDTVKLNVIKKGDPAEIEVTLGVRPQAADIPGVRPLDGLPLDGVPQDLADRVRGMIEGNIGELKLEMGQPLDMAPQMEEAMREMRQRMQRAMQGLDVPAAPGVGRIQIHQGATFRMMDEQGSVEIKSNDGGKEVTVRDKDNNITWTGPWDTDQDKAAAPDDIRQRVERFNFDDRFKGNGLRFQMRGGIQPE